MKSLIISTVLFAALTSTAAAFDFNVDAYELIDRRGTLTVRDLAVGEVGIVAYPDLCVRDDKLVAIGMLALAEEVGSYASVVYRFKKLPGGSFSISMSITDKSDQSLEYWIANVALSALMRPCLGTIDEFGIADINGETDLVGLLNSSK